MNRRNFLKLLPASLGSLLLSPELRALTAEQSLLTADPTAVADLTTSIINKPSRTTAKQSTYKTLLQQEPLAGFQYYQGEKVWQQLHIDAPLSMRREAQNHHDPAAIEILWNNRKLGYVPRSRNSELAKMLDQGVNIHAKIIDLQETDNPWDRVEMAFYRVLDDTDN